MISLVGDVVMKTIKSRQMKIASKDEMSILTNFL